MFKRIVSMLAVLSMISSIPPAFAENADAIESAIKNRITVKRLCEEE